MELSGYRYRNSIASIGNPSVCFKRGSVAGTFRPQRVPPVLRAPPLRATVHSTRCAKPRPQTRRSVGNCGQRLGVLRVALKKQCVSEREMEQMTSRCLPGVEAPIRIHNEYVPTEKAATNPRSSLNRQRQTIPLDFGCKRDNLSASLELGFPLVDPLV